jgi:hypothetical protein
MPDYNFENLGPKDFEELTNALGTAYIARGLRPFGVGADGGREATFHGKMSYPAAAKPWNGYLVVQCKQKQALGTTRKADADWAIAQLNAEMKLYQNKTEPRPIPDYYIFVTNVVLSPKLKTGGKDRFVTKLEEWATTLGIKGVDVWDRDKLSRLLDGKQEIAKRFGFLHAGDLIHRAVEQVLAQDDRLKNIISVFLEAELRADQYVRLTQAGHVGDDQTPLARVFVDLQAIEHDEQEEAGNKFYVVKTVQQVSDRELRPSLFEAERRKKTRRGKSSNIPAWEDFSRFVFIGGPGQGKTTLAQHLAQRHRAAILSSKSFDKLERETHGILRVIRDSAIESGIGLPIHPRIPFRVVLEQFADALAKKEVNSVLDYIAAVISKRTTMKFSADEAEKLLQQTPWFIAFDGLDEVPAASNRTQVLNAVSAFLSLSRVMDADVLVAATTRPQGYEHEFAPAHFNHIKLIYLDKQEALAYAQKFVDAKYVADTDRRERIMQRLKTAAEEDATARLMISPLQVTIMAALVDLVGNPPRERYPLFNRYYDIVYQREQERGLEFSDVLADYRGPIDTLHDHIGLVLQVEAEKAGSAQSKISKERLEDFIRTHLIDEGYEGYELEAITASILKVALLRLVFIVPLEDARYGFEVRSLQEFAAARAIMQGKYDTVKQRIKIIAPVPYWRNTTLFAVGRAFAERDEQQCDMITQLCRELNDADVEPVISKTLAGSRLALDILEDGILDRRPKYKHLFLETAFQLMEFSFDESPFRIANQYSSDNEARYTKQIHDFVSRGHKISVCVLLMYIIYKNQNETLLWAETLLQELWPDNVTSSCSLLAIASRYMLWSEWQVKKAVEAARVSSIEWVINNLTGIIPDEVKWISECRQLLIRQGRHEIKDDCWRAPLNFDNKSFGYVLGKKHPDKNVLEAIKNANPIHSDWMPFIIGQEFILDPTAENLAQTIEHLANNKNYSKYYSNSNLPWILGTLLHLSESNEQLLKYAKHVRLGGFGRPSDWKSAESRWRKKGFSVADWFHFDDIAWPFSSGISEKGIVPLPVASIDDFEESAATALELLKLFKKAKSDELSSKLAQYALRYINIIPIVSDTPAPDVTIQDVYQLATRANSRVELSTIAEAIKFDEDFDYVKDFSILEALGNRIDLEPYYSLFREERMKYVSKIATSITALINEKKPSEGILRILVSLAVIGASIPHISLQMSNLSQHGRLLYGLLLLLSDESIMPAEQLAQHLAEQWIIGDTEDEDTDLQKVMRNIEQGVILSNYTLTVLSILLSKDSVDVFSKESIIDTILQQNRYRTSGLITSEGKVNFNLQTEKLNSTNQASF